MAQYMEKTTRRTAEKMKLIAAQKRKAPEESQVVETVKESEKESEKEPEKEPEEPEKEVVKEEVPIESNM